MLQVATPGLVWLPELVLAQPLVTAHAVQAGPQLVCAAGAAFACTVGAIFATG